MLVGGGSGVVPLMAMLRLARKLGRPELLRLVVSVRTPGDLYYSDELPGPESTVVFTRSAPPGTQRPAGHLTTADLVPCTRPGVMAYVCGSSGFADAASYMLVDLGVPAAQVRVERFGAFWLADRHAHFGQGLQLLFQVGHFVAQPGGVLKA